MGVLCVWLCLGINEVLNDNGCVCLYECTCFVGCDIVVLLMVYGCVRSAQIDGLPWRTSICMCFIMDMWNVYGLLPFPEMIVN